MSRKPPSDDEPRWRRGTDVEGVTPPGRRLEKQRTGSRWRASGVSGVTPPGSASPADSPSARWVLNKGKKGPTTRLQKARSVEKSQATAELDLGRPMAGFVPSIFEDGGDPDHLGALLEEMSAFVAAHRPPVERAESFKELLNQSRAPFEVVVAFTILSALIGKSSALRRRYALPLERGAKTFFNLGRRLDPNLKPPRGLAPETVDAIFFDLPEIALEIPYAYAVDAFARQVELLAEEELDRDRALADEAYRQWSRFVERRAFGDRALRDLFPYRDPFDGPG